MNCVKINHLHQAKSFDEVLKIVKESQNHAVIGGGAWLKRLPRKIDKAILLDQLALDYIKEHDAYIAVGSMTTLQSVVDARCLQEIGSGLLSNATAQVMGVALRNIATIGGSVVGRYGFSDIIPPLLALDAKLIFHELGEITLEKYLQQKGKTSDLLLEVQIPKKNKIGYFKKVSNTSLDFSILNITISKQDQNICIIIGARPGGAAFAREAMQYLSQVDQLTKTHLKKATQLVLDEVAFASNTAASQQYRETLAKVYVQRGLKEVYQNES